MNRFLGMGFFGLEIIAFSIGAMLSLSLVQFSLFIFLFGIFLSINYIHSGIVDWNKGKKGTRNRQIYGLAGALLLALTFGIQSPQLPFREVFLVIGILFAVPLTWMLFQRL